MGLKEHRQEYQSLEPSLKRFADQLRTELMGLSESDAIGLHGERPVVETRLKSFESVLANLQDDDAHRSPRQLLEGVDDLVGARLTVLSENQVEKAEELLRGLSLVRILTDDPPDPSDDYQALHLKGVASKPVDGFRPRVEIQVRRVFHDAWARLSHAYVYKREEAAGDFPEYMRALNKVVRGLTEAADIAGKQLEADSAVEADLRELLLPSYDADQAQEMLTYLDMKSARIVTGSHSWRSSEDLVGDSGQSSYRAFPRGQIVPLPRGGPLRFRIVRKDEWPQYMLLAPGAANQESTIEIRGEWDDVRSIYLLAAAGNGWEIPFKDQVIGCMRICDDSDEWVDYPLLLNHNIREWAAPRELRRVCNNLCRVSRTLEVWKDENQSALLDCLRFATYPISRNLRKIRVTARYEGDLKRAEGQDLPTLNIFGLTLGRRSSRASVV